MTSAIARFADRRPTLRHLVVLCVLTLLVGIATGLIAAGLATVMHAIEQLVYGQHEGDVAVVTEGTTGTQRFLGIVIAGLIAGPAWAALRRLREPLLSVEDGMEGRRMPVFETLVNVFLQMGTVAAGASVGRENAPREASAMFSSQLLSRLGVDAETQRVIVAAAAGAGLGAIYHIPLAGAIFALEILLGSISATAVMVVLACSAIATVVSGIAVGNEPLYAPLNLSEEWGNLSAALLVGVIAGLGGYAFRSWTRRCEASAPKGWHAAWTIPLAFAIVGGIALWLPEVLGNGRNAATPVLMTSSTTETGPLHLTVWFVVALFVAKLVAVLITLRSGAVGGVLTPGFALGAMLGFLIGSVASPILAEFSITIPLSDFALLGACAFLSTTMAAPLFAFVVTVEFTGQSSEAYLALFLAAATAALVGAVVEKRAMQKQELPEPSR